MIGFRPRTITRWCREGKLNGAVKVGRVWRIPEESPILYIGREVRNARLESK
jgi:predicted site-specific integrase-resolvase